MRREHLWAILSALAWFGFFAVMIAVPASRRDIGMAEQIVSVLLGVIVLLGVLILGERPRWPARVRWVIAACGLAAIVLPYLLNLHSPWARALSTLGIIAVAMPVGYWIGDRMEKVSNLIPLAVAMSVADIYSVFAGPSRQVSQQLAVHYSEIGNRIADLGPQATPQAIQQATATMRAPLADYIVVHLPIAGMQTTMPVLGIGDFIALGFLFRAAWLHRLNPRALYVAALIAVAIALSASWLSDRTLPALPFIALGVVGYLALVNPRVRRLDRREAVLTVAVVAIFAALLAAKWLLRLI